MKQLEAVVYENEGIGMEIRHRVSAAWGNWKKCSEVLYDRHMYMTLQGYIENSGPALGMKQRQPKAKKGDWV